MNKTNICASRPVKVTGTPNVDSRIFEMNIISPAVSRRPPGTAGDDIPSGGANEEAIIVS